MTNWDDYPAQLDALFGTGSVSEDSGGGSLWRQYLSGAVRDAADLWLFAGYSSGDDAKLRQFHQDAVKGYNDFLGVWHKSFRPDADNMYYLKNVVNTWIDDIMRPLRLTPGDTRDSKLLQAWYGEGATKYLEVVKTQSAAMEEFNSMSVTMATSLDTANSNLKGIFQACKSYGDSVEAQLKGLPGGYGDNGYAPGMHVCYGASVFPQMHQWLSDLYSSGDWVQNFKQLGYDFEDMQVKSTSFKVGSWPKSVVSDLNTMKNGDGGLAGQTGRDQTRIPETPQTGGDPTTPVSGPSQDPTTGDRNGIHPGE